MSMIKQIEKDLAVARKEKSQVIPWLSTLLAEIKAIGKNAGNRETTEEEAVHMVQKFRKGVLETEEIVRKQNQPNAEKVKELETERALYESYLPKMMTEMELEKIIEKILQQSDTQTMGDVMKVLKAEFQGQYDGKMASQLVKKRLQ